MNKKNRLFLFGLFVLLLLVFIVNNYTAAYSVQLISFVAIFLGLMGLMVFSYRQQNKQLLSYFVVLTLIDIGFIFFLIR